MSVKVDKLEPKKAYTRSRGAEHGGWEVIWLDPASKAVRRIIRKDEKTAKLFAAKKQADLERGEGGETELPFGDSVSGLDGAVGGAWLELLWAGAITVANNPGSEVTQRALSAVCKAAQAATKFVRRDLLQTKDEEVDNPSFRREAASVFGPMLLAEGCAPAEVAKVLKLIRGGGSEEDAS